MEQIKVLVLRAAGVNCDLETQVAFESAGAAAERVHINRLIENPSMLDGFQIIVFPGGFSYGDDVAAGQGWHALWFPVVDSAQPRAGRGDGAGCLWAVHLH